MERISLMPGVNLTASKSHKFKTGCFSVNFLRPLCRQEAAKNALLCSVLLRGCRRYPDIRAMSAAMDELYGTEVGTLVRKKGEVQAVGLYADFVEDALVPGENVFSQVVDLVAEILLDPVLENGAFKADYVEREKENLINTQRARINSKRSYAAGQMVKAMCREEAYGVERLGEDEDVLPLTAKDLYEHYKNFLQSSQVEICYMGAQDADTVAAAFRRALKDLPRGEMTPVGTAFRPGVGQVREVTEALEVTQGKLCMGFRLDLRGDSPDWPAMVLLNSVFGSGVTSKLFVNVREKRSLCYYASSSLEKFKGLMVVSSGISFDKVQVVKAAVLEQLEACRQGDITEEELTSARMHLVSGVQTQKDSPGQMDEYCLSQAIMGSQGSLDEFLEKVSRVTREDLACMANMIHLDTVYFLKGVE